LNFLLLVWVVRLWTAPERIVIGSDTVRVTSGLFGITRTLPLSEVTAIHAARITSPFLVSVRIRGKAWHTIGVGQGIRESREAEWLALQRSRTAGIAPADPAPINEAAEQMKVIAALAKELNRAEGRTRLGKFRTVIARAAREDQQDCPRFGQVPPRPPPRITTSKLCVGMPQSPLKVDPQFTFTSCAGAGRRLAHGADMDASARKLATRRYPSRSGAKRSFAAREPTGKS
jgi:hypothetical protein